MTPAPVDKDTPLRLDRAAEQHTPGPWTTNFHHTQTVGGRTYAFVHAGSVVPIAAVVLGVEGCSQDEGRANGRLIDAAPKMLKALQHCLGILCESGNLNNYRNLSDEELGKAWIETAKEAATVINEAMGITSPAELAFPDGERG